MTVAGIWSSPRKTNSSQLPRAGGTTSMKYVDPPLKETLAVATEVRMALFRPPLPKAFRQVAAVLRRREPKKGVDLKRGHHGGEEPPPQRTRPRLKTGA